MKISELIDKLQELREEHGDVDVFLEYDGQECDDFELVFYNVRRVWTNRLQPSGKVVSTHQDFNYPRVIIS